jgi:sugar fermentation stimulation protein A
MELGELIEGTFIERLNRFVCSVHINGKERKALLRNTGRLKELLFKGNRVFLRPKRVGKLPYELVLAQKDGKLVCVDSHLPPKLLCEYLQKEGSPWRVESLKFERREGNSRFDLIINGKILVETKSVNLVKGRVALFPDAPTTRGTKHVQHLMALRDRFEPALVFVVQREDAELFMPNYEVDPSFSRAVENFIKEGLPVYAFLCRVTPGEIYIWKEIPVRIK